MNNKRINYIFYILLFISGVCIYSAFAAYNHFSYPEFLDISSELRAKAENSVSQDSVTTPKAKPRYPVAKTSSETYEDLIKNHPADLDFW